MMYQSIHKFKFNRYDKRLGLMTNTSQKSRKYGTVSCDKWYVPAIHRLDLN